MARLGSDLWAPTGVAVVKSKMSVEVMRLLKQHIDTIRSPQSQKDVEADDKDDKTEDANHDEENTDIEPAGVPASSQDNNVAEQRLKQLLFDALYLQRFFSSENNPAQTTDTLITKIDIADLNDAALQRLRKNAAEYAKKTYLLFALLA